MDVAIYRKNDHLLKILIKDDTGAALDVSGAALVYLVETKAGTRIIEKTLENGITVNNATDGQIEVHFTHDDTDLNSGEYVTELLVVDVDGNRYTAYKGTLTILTSIAAKE